MLPFTLILALAVLLMQQVSAGFGNLNYHQLMQRCMEDRCIKSREYSAMLGRAAWTFLHTLTVNYPEEPTEEDKTDILQFIHLFGKFYPCRLCSRNFAKEIIKTPPRVDSRHEIATWLCELHNSVNERLGKPIFDCTLVFDVWQRDPEDGYCPDVCPINFDSDAPEEAVSYINSPMHSDKQEDE